MSCTAGQRLSSSRNSIRYTLEQCSTVFSLKLLHLFFFRIPSTLRRSLCKVWLSDLSYLSFEVLLFFRKYKQEASIQSNVDLRQNEGEWSVPKVSILSKRMHWSVFLFFFPAGEEISLSTKNDLLALVAYHGLGSMWATQKDAPKVMKFYQELNWWPRKEREGEEGEKKREGEEAVALGEALPGEEAALEIDLSSVSCFP